MINSLIVSVMRIIRERGKYKVNIKKNEMKVD